MVLSLEKVLAKAKVANEEIAYIYDAPVHYVVLTKQDNTWSWESINRYLAVLD